VKNWGRLNRGGAKYAPELVDNTVIVHKFVVRGNDPVFVSGVSLQLY